MTDKKDPEFDDIMDALLKVPVKKPSKPKRPSKPSKPSKPKKPKKSS